MSTNEQAPEKQISVSAQYVKDLSFESPNSPNSLVASQERPKIDVAVDVKAAASSTQENLFEVILKITAKASRANESKEEVMFVCETSYAGIFTLTGVPENEREPALLIFCPSLLFPYARRIISDAVQDGGFPPLMLDPIDFGRLYASRQ